MLCAELSLPHYETHTGLTVITSPVRYQLRPWRSASSLRLSPLLSFVDVKPVSSRTDRQLCVLIDLLLVLLAFSPTTITMWKPVTMHLPTADDHQKDQITYCLERLRIGWLSRV